MKQEQIKEKLIDNNTLLVEYCLFPYELGNKTLGEVKDWMKKNKANKNDIEKFESLLFSNPTNFVSVSISQKDNFRICPYKYRLKKMSWWERNFTYSDPYFGV